MSSPTLEPAVLNEADAEPRLIADQVYARLSDAIFSGELPAGSRLRVRDLAEMVGTSVMPVREAVRRLEEAGLATRSPHKGAVVKKFTVAELMHVYDVRSLLEVEATRQAVLNVSEADLVYMRSACARMEEAVATKQVNDALDWDERLLRRLYSASRNPVLCNLIDMLWIQCRAYKVIGATAALAADDGSLWTPQPSLVQAVTSRDVSGAVEITRASLVSARRRLEENLASS
ncbi:MAG: hypothetical protein QOH68_65 [Nocardioidaceae bacterium]|jgi:DNA-binding GntR family transcriptional regulator|nr:hypothetical protein [Nocardioidaceae bacterium]